MINPLFIKNGRLKIPPRTGVFISKQRDSTWLLTKPKSKATAPMFGYLYGYLYPTILEEMGVIPTVKEINELDALFKRRYGVAGLKRRYEVQNVTGRAVEGVKQIYKRAGREYALVLVESLEPKSKADYTVEEMQDFWMAIHKFAAEFWGMVLHDPDPKWKDAWIKQPRSKSAKQTT